MLHVHLSEPESIAILELEGALCEEDFKRVADAIDPFIEEHGKLNGLIIRVKSFPGWDSFAAFLKHIQFVNEHHRNVSHVALVTDSLIGELGEHVASHFVSAKIKTFAFDDLVKASAWIQHDE